MMPDEFVEVAEDEISGQPIVKDTRSHDELLRVLRERQGAYSRIFDGARKDDVAIVMDDLAKFCRAFESVYKGDTHLTHVAIGRKEVFDRIRDFSKLNIDELFYRYHTRAAGEKQ